MPHPPRELALFSQYARAVDIEAEALANRAERHPATRETTCFVANGLAESPAA